MRTEKMSLGAEGEKFAADELEKMGWEIIDRNFKVCSDEIDVIARAPDKTLVFVEVKTMRWYRPEGLRPENQITREKLVKLRRAASLYAGHNRTMIDERMGWRIDVMALTKIGNDFLINHYENV